MKTHFSSAKRTFIEHFLLREITDKRKTKKKILDFLVSREFWHVIPHNTIFFKW